MKALLKNITFWIIFIAVLLSLFVLFIAPIFFESFEMLTLRILIAFILMSGTLISILAYTLFFKEETQKRLKERKKRKEKAKAYSKYINKKIKELKNRFADAQRVIKNAAIYDDQNRASADLPWYLVVGKSGEGKTTLLENSGLDFPLNSSYEVDEEGAEDDKSFEWYFAEHAVFIDMPGDYIEQKNIYTDAPLWEAFLTLFKHKKWKRPINGIVLTLSVDTLIKKSEDELESYGKKLRERFEEVSRTFNANIPIYLLVTKTDHVEGFNEYFSQISAEDKLEILGFTLNDKQNSVDSKIIQPEFEKLLFRLNSSVLDKLQNEHNQEIRSKTVLFADAFTQTFDRLKLLIETSFAKTRYRAPLHLRGIYFTSIPHKQMYFQNEEVESEKPKNRGMFIFKLLKDVIFPEADTIKMDDTYRKKLKKRQFATFALAIAMSASLTYFWVQDFHNRFNSLDKLEKDMSSYDHMRDGVTGNSDFEYVIDVLNTISTLKTENENSFFERIWKPAYFKVDARNEKLESLYQEALVHLLLPRVAKFIENQMGKSLSDYDQTWECTKAYLMLNDPSRRDNGFLAQWMEAGWGEFYVDNQELRHDLNRHWQYLLEYGFDAYALNEKVLTTSRKKLLGLGHEALVYKQLKDVAKDTKLQDFQFSDVMGSYTNTFDGNNYIVPGFYTKQGFETLISDKGRDRIESLVKNNWVVGYSTKLTTTQLNELFEKVQSFYFRDYKKHWLMALSNLNVPSYDSLTDIANQLTVLTSTDSPIYSILESFKEHTLIYTPAEKLELEAKKKEGKLDKAAALLTKKSIIEAEQLMKNDNVKAMRNFFNEYHKLLTPDTKGFDEMKLAMGKMSEVYQEVTAIYGSVTPEKDAFEIVKNRIEGKHKPIIMQMNSLPLPVEKWFKKALRNDWDYLLTKTKEYINLRYKEDVLAFYNEKMEGRYPIKNNEFGHEVQLQDFEEFFKEGGILDHFYEQYVSKFLQLDFRRNGYKFRVIDGSQIPISKEFIQAMLAVRDIRQSFFTSNADSLRAIFYIQPNYLGRNLATMELHYDNQYIAYEHGPIKARKVQWPAETQSDVSELNVFDLQGQRIATLKKEGAWSIFKLFDSLNAKEYKTREGLDSILLEYKDSEYKTNFYLNGNVAKKFSATNPLRHFALIQEL